MTPTQQRDRELAEKIRDRFKLYANTDLVELQHYITTHLQPEREALAGHLETAIKTAEGLVDQQAMPEMKGGVIPGCKLCGQIHAEKLTTPFPGTTACPECGWAIDGVCFECGGNHQRTGARIDCIRHWKYRALIAENKLLHMDANEPARTA